MTRSTLPTRLSHSAAALLLNVSLLLAAYAGLPQNAAAAIQDSALAVLGQRNPEVARDLDPASRAVLARLAGTDFDTFMSGKAGAESVRLIDGRSVGQFLKSIFGNGAYAIPSYSVDSGGGRATGGGYTLLGTIGQADAGKVEGAGYTLIGGFRGRLISGSGTLPTPIFRDGFES